MRLCDLETLYYRETINETDAHGYSSKSFGETLKSLKGTIHPQTIAFEIKDVGLSTNGDYYIFMPIDIQSSISIEQGYGLYLPNEDTDKDPQWIVSNDPFKYRNHQILILQNKAEYNVRS